MMPRRLGIAGGHRGVVLLASELFLCSSSKGLQGEADVFCVGSYWNPPGSLADVESRV
jgi:hypothetical protein